MTDGKRTTVSAKVSEALALALDDARGSASRSAYLEALLADHLGSVPAAALKRRRVPEKRGGQVAPPNAPLPSKSAVLPDPPPVNLGTAVTDPPVPVPRCAHAGVRVIGGWCRDCQRDVRPGGG